MGDMKKKPKKTDLHLLANNNSISKYAFSTEYLQSTDKHNKKPAK